MTAKINTVGIIGLGHIGMPLYCYFKDKMTTFGYDKTKSFDSLETTLKADVLFLCLPTPFVEGRYGFQLTILEDILNKIPSNKLVIIKSTLLPGTTAGYQKLYPKLKLAFMPEFLTEKNLIHDMYNPDTNIYGYTERSQTDAEVILDLLPKAKKDMIVPASEAEMIKVARNNFLVCKLVFFNMIYDLCQANDIDYELVREGIIADKRIGASHTKVWHNGGRGGGGTCFPKDTSAFRSFAKEFGIKRAYQFIDLYTNINLDLVEGTGKDKGGQYHQ